MKKMLLLILLVVPALLLHAQKYDPIKNKLVLNQYKEAKADLDKEWATAKFTSKPEAYILKATIYGGLAMAEGTKGTPAGDQLLGEADAAFQKYKELDPSLALITDPIYQNAPINIYSNYYTSGYQDYTAKKWDVSYGKLKKAVVYSDLLIEKKVFPAALDTNVLILAGITAEQSKNIDDAVKYYSRLADKNITGEGFESVYRFLVTHYFAKQDYQSFEKYKEAGQKLFPKNEFFTYDKIDFSVGLSEKLDEKIAGVEKILATDPNSFKANQVLGEVIFDALNPREETTPLPPNAEALEQKMVVAFGKAAVAKPDYEIPYIYLGDHFINKAVKVNKEREDHAAATKARTKTGTMASKEDVAKRDALDKKYGEELENAREPYEKAAAIFATKKNLELRDKQQYKKAASYLADIYAWKKIQAKAKPADAAKFAAEEKKWNDRWESIK